ncbi:MAG TPA: biotin--[acetyl-CoA-carboxylase] ligase [Pseudolabrys sp.]|jgi:BirA family biotin operon repressor/biotin-[acetyl-CoA-carboxylase] ligase
MRLDPVAVAAGVRLALHEVIGSTNAEAKRLARGGERGPLWVVARTQTQGRGRRDNAWVSQPGNLFASLLLTDPAPPARAPELAFVSVLALTDAVLACAPALGGQVTVKWPNDMLVDGHKAAGILIEAEGSAVVIGLGVNCVSHPPETAFPATDLASVGAVVDADELFAALSAAMVARLAQWSAGAGFAGIRTDWLARAAGLGAPIRVRLPGREMTGQFTGLDAQGRLLLGHADGTTEIVTAGDVFSLATEARH